MFFWGFLQELHLRINSRSSFCGFHKECNLGIPPGSPPGDFTRNFFWRFSQKSHLEIPLSEIPRGTPSIDYSTNAILLDILAGDSSRTFLRIFYVGITPGFLFGNSSANFFCGFPHISLFFLKFVQVSRAPLMIPNEALAEIYLKISPGN